MELESKRIFGFVGPSGVGKGFIKKVIQESLPETFSEPIVATTRSKRSSDGLDRLPGLPHEQFLDMVSRGQILFPHQPFGESTDWYGFVASSFSGEKPIVIEVHVDNVKLFGEKFDDRRVLIALVAELEYLASNMEQRGDTSHEIEERLTTATDEIEKIHLLHQEGLINYVIAVNSDNRDTFAGLVLELLSKHMSIC